MNAAQPAIIRKAGVIADLDAVMGVMRAAFDPAFGEAWNRAQVGGMLDLGGSWLTLALCDGRVIGFALLRSVLDEAELLLLAVDPAWRGRGIGRFLLSDSIAEARSRNIRHIHLEVREGNKAMDLYKSAGFVHCNTRKSYYRGKDGQLFDAFSFIMDLK